MAETPVIDSNDAAILVEPELRRRDFLNIAAISFAGVGAVAVVVPLINQMSPSADVLAEATVELDVAKIAEGQAIKAIFRSRAKVCRAS